MNTRISISPRRSLTILSIACALFPLLLYACRPANASTGLPPVQTPAMTLPAQPAAAQSPTGEPAPIATQTPAQAVQPPSGAPADLTLTLSGVAQDQVVETVPAVAATEGGPWWEAMPQYRRVTLQGYPVANHLMQPQIFIYPAADLASSNEAAGEVLAGLQALLGSRGSAERLPFLPLFNAAQVMHAQVQYLDFKNGSGVRYLTQFDQAPLPVNSYELIYTFQGLTGDGKYYIAAVLPVTHPDLPADQQVSPEQAAELSDFPAYLSKTVAWLDGQPASTFTPDLAKLDAMIGSIEVK